MEKRYLKKRMVITEISGETYLTMVAIAVRIHISRMQVRIPNWILSFIGVTDIHILSIVICLKKVISKNPNLNKTY